MKICYLANASSIHTKRWAKAMAEKGCQVDVVSFDKAHIDGANVHYIEPVNREMDRLPSDPKNLSYIVKYMEVKKVVNSLQPDIVHAHYATGYGLTGALCNIHPYVISTWGTDIFEAPRKNIVFKNIVKYNLKKADYITATSRALTYETMLYTDKRVHTIPFGIDTDKFCKHEKKESSKIIIGIVKALEEVYGIRYLIEAFAKVYSECKDIELLIVGGGTLEGELKSLCSSLSIDKNVNFVGKISNDDVPKYLNMMDIFVMPSLNESFGVAALEAQACEIPVIASKVGGVPEVVLDGETGFLVPPYESGVLSEKIKVLLDDSLLRRDMGKKGRSFVEQNYSWKLNVDDMYNLYIKILNESKKGNV